MSDNNLPADLENMPSVPDSGDMAPAPAGGMSTPPVPKKTAPKREGIFEFLTGRKQGKIFRLRGKKIRIGRSHDNDIILDDTTVSGLHAEVVISSRGFQIVDTDSTNGVYINKKKEKHRFLKNNDVVRIGDHEFKFILIEEKQLPRADVPEMGKKKKIGPKHIVILIVAGLVGYAMMMDDKPKKKSRKVKKKIEAAAPVEVKLPEWAEKQKETKSKETVQDTSIKSHFDLAMKEYHYNNYSRALNELQIILDLNPAYTPAVDMINKLKASVQTKAKANFEIGQKYLNRGRVKLAKQYFKYARNALMVLPDDPHYEKAMDYIKECDTLLNAQAPKKEEEQGKKLENKPN